MTDADITALALRIRYSVEEGVVAYADMLDAADALLRFLEERKSAVPNAESKLLQQV